MTQAVNTNQEFLASHQQVITGPNTVIKETDMVRVKTPLADYIMPIVKVLPTQIVCKGFGPNNIKLSLVEGGLMIIPKPISTVTTYRLYRPIPGYKKPPGCFKTIITKNS